MHSIYSRLSTLAHPHIQIRNMFVLKICFRFHFYRKRNFMDFNTEHWSKNTNTHKHWKMKWAHNLPRLAIASAFQLWKSIKHYDRCEKICEKSELGIVNAIRCSYFICSYFIVMFKFKSSSVLGIQYT